MNLVLWVMKNNFILFILTPNGPLIITLQSPQLKVDGNDYS